MRFFLPCLRRRTTLKRLPLRSRDGSTTKSTAFVPTLARLTFPLDSIRRLLELVPDSEQSKRLTDLTNRVSDLQDKCEALRVKLRDMKEGGENQTVGFGALSTEVSDVSRDTQTLSQEVLVKAKNAENVAEHRYELVTRASIGLFALGLIMAFVAKLAGVDVFEMS